MSESKFRAEGRFDVEFVSPLALAEKQIQQAYRPYIQIHKWFARRPGALFRTLLLSEFGDERPVRASYFHPHKLAGSTIYDPFMGGGTPLLEANRLGMNTVGNDINPMATWLVRRSLADIELEAFEAIGARVVEKAEKQLSEFYRTECKECGQQAPVKYFIWVKTWTCEGCGTSIELFPGYRIANNVRHPNVVIYCPKCHDLFEMESEPESGSSIRCTSCQTDFDYDGPAGRSKYACPECDHNGRYGSGESNQPPEHKLVAIEYHCGSCKSEHDGRFFKSPGESDFQRFERAAAALAESDVDHLIPDEVIPDGDETTRLHKWGYEKYSELFNPRQLLGLTCLLQKISEVESTEIRHALATVFSDMLRYQNMLARYDTYSLKCQDIFSVHGYPVGLVQCENNVLGIPGVGSGGFRHFLRKYRKAKDYCLEPWDKKIEGGKKTKIRVPGERIAAKFVDSQPAGQTTRQAWIECRSSTETQLEPGSIDAVITDPPYFDNLQYAELIDFCYVWLRRLIDGDVPYFDGTSTRADNELTGNDTEGRDLSHFTEGLSEVFGHSAEALKPGGLFAFTYHHNDIDAYLPLIVAMCDAGLTTTASLPCPAEMSASLHIAGTSSSVVDTIICARSEHRPRRVEIDRLTSELSTQVRELRSGGVEVTEGDTRCMALGLVTVASNNNILESSWEREAPVEDRLQRAGECVRSQLGEIGGLDEWVEKAMNAAEEAGSTASAETQLALFGSR